MPPPLPSQPSPIRSTHENERPCRLTPQFRQAAKASYRRLPSVYMHHAHDFWPGRNATDSAGNIRHANYHYLCHNRAHQSYRRHNHLGNISLSFSLDQNLSRCALAVRILSGLHSGPTHRAVSSTNSPTGSHLRGRQYPYRSFIVPVLSPFLPRTRNLRKKRMTNLPLCRRPSQRRSRNDPPAFFRATTVASYPIKCGAANPTDPEPESLHTLPKSQRIFSNGHQ
jgi:hypothetical protein